MTPQPEPFQTLLQQTEALTPEEKLRLISHLADSLRDQQRPQGATALPRYKWSEIQGIFQEPLCPEDAQDWITHTRREADERRERALRSDT